MNSIRSASVIAAFLLAAAGLSAQTNALNQTGNVGIGTTTPAFPLDVRDPNGGYVQLNPGTGALEIASGDDATSYIDFKGNANLGSDYKGRFCFSDSSCFSLWNKGTSDFVLNLVSSRTNAGLKLTAGTENDAAGELWFVRTGPTAGDLYLGGNAAGRTIFRSGGYAIRMVIDSTGNVGIGTTQPDCRLALRAENVELSMGRSLVDGNGYARSGFTADFTQYIASNARWDGTQWQYVNPGGYGGFATRFINSGGRFQFDVANGGSAPVWRTSFLITDAGNVGIGTINPTNKLEVAGTIRAKEVIVETTGWSDYVFAPDYRLAPLSEVKAHIAAQGHLPGIPSAAEVAAQGVSVGDMQAKLLAKIEELTLRQIAQEERLATQAARIAQLEVENAARRFK